MPETPDPQLVEEFVQTNYELRRTPTPQGKNPFYILPLSTYTDEGEQVASRINAAIDASKNPEDLALEFAKAIMKTLQEKCEDPSSQLGEFTGYGIEFLQRIRAWQKKREREYPNITTS